MIENGYVLFRGSANNWWERSPNSGNSNNFCNVNSDGSANNNNASNTNGLSPFGCLLLVRKVAKVKLEHLVAGVHTHAFRGEIESWHIVT